MRGCVAPADEVVSVCDGGAVGTPGVAVAAAAAGVVVFVDMDVAVVVGGGGVVAVPPVVTVGVGGCCFVVGGIVCVWVSVCLIVYVAVEVASVVDSVLPETFMRPGPS